MRVLAISGSLRAGSTNIALLTALARAAPPEMDIRLCDRIGTLPIFSPDMETPEPPAPVRAFQREVADADGLIISSPEYVRSIPGGLKNAIDWLVSGEQLIDKPVALAHASHRGDDMLETLRRVLATVTTRFAEDIFIRVPVMKRAPDEIAGIIAAPDRATEARIFLGDFAKFCVE